MVNSTHAEQAFAHSINDAVRIYGLGRSKIYEMIAAGELKARKIGRRTLVLREDMEKLVREGVK